MNLYANIELADQAAIWRASLMCKGYVVERAVGDTRHRTFRVYCCTYEHL